LFNNRGKLNELQQQVATGKKIDSPSDDATAAIAIMSSNTSLNKIDIYGKNVDSAISELDITDQQLSSITELIQRARTLATQAANATNGTDELKSINEEIKQLTDSLKAAGNTKFGSKYIFGGTNTDKEPFTTSTGDEINYVGTLSTENYRRKVEISDNVTVDINVAGDDIFGYYRADADSPTGYSGEGLFNTLKTLSNELTANPPNYENIREKIGDLDNDLETVSNVRARLGGVSNRLEMTKTRLDDNKINFTKYKSGLEDVDMSKAIADLQFQETALQVSLQVGSKLIQPSLLNYM